MGFLPELKVDGVKMAQLTPMLVYLSKVRLDSGSYYMTHISDI